MKKEIKKLSLKKETVASLNNSDMSRILGGITGIKPPTVHIAANNYSLGVTTHPGDTMSLV